MHPSNQFTTPRVNLLPQYPLSQTGGPQVNPLPRYPFSSQTVGPSPGYSGPTNYSSNVGPTVIRTKELKLNGQIGEPGEAGKLNYGSLFYQITAAKARKYPSEEIIAAVI